MCIPIHTHVKWHGCCYLYTRWPLTCCNGCPHGVISPTGVLTLAWSDRVFTPASPVTWSPSQARGLSCDRPESSNSLRSICRSYQAMVCADTAQTHCKTSVLVVIISNSKIYHLLLPINHSFHTRTLNPSAGHRHQNHNEVQDGGVLEVAQAREMSNVRSFLAVILTSLSITRLWQLGDRSSACLGSQAWW